MGGEATKQKTKIKNNEVGFIDSVRVRLEGMTERAVFLGRLRRQLVVWRLLRWAAVLSTSSMSSGAGGALSPLAPGSPLQLHHFHFFYLLRVGSNIL